MLHNILDLIIKLVAIHQQSPLNNDNVLAGECLGNELTIFVTRTILVMG